MKVDWVKKYLEFEHEGAVVKLQGITREANMAATVPSVHATEVE
jgi:hypothetical protein